LSLTSSKPCTIVLSTKTENPRRSEERSPIESFYEITSYLLDATSPNRLWFHQFCERNRFHLNSLLRQPVEEFAA